MRGEALTDREKFTTMLDGAGVVWKNANEGPYKLPGPDNGVTITEGEGPQNKGYDQFFAVFDFDEAGKLTAVEVWE